MLNFSYFIINFYEIGRKRALTHCTKMQMNSICVFFIAFFTQPAIGSKINKRANQ